MERRFRNGWGLNRVIRLLILMVLTCSVAIACSSNTGSTGAGDLPSEITVATEDDYPPFDFQQEGKHVGYNQDLLELLTRDAPFQVKQEVLPWQGILAGVASGKYDATSASVTILEERASAVDFTMPTTELTNFFLKRKGDSAINTVQDFANKNIAVQQGGATAQLLEDVVKPELEKSGATLGNVAEYGSFADAYTDLTNKRVDIVINNIVALSQVVQAKPDLYELGEQVGPTLYAALGVNKNNKPLLDFFNTQLAKYKASGEIQALQSKWLNVSFDNLPDEPLLPDGTSLSES
ncbi:transporter substrate-binding domain-containing protein [Oculatella sp. LEGE 06141]|uniref:transporter substrate-binding domain-containing protein n=1 Tax=Oculatella sp. LEGE 06141 TaxID=1828648 RepID=UPI001880B2D7|nr:transporter substrate-binding domain-containing protein [Oculatella sp. LEGE 06141]MBE9178948.1 transporter substrate-binding domain-containing protein [Oculatella sp. LEGE 06141]